MIPTVHTPPAALLLRVHTFNGFWKLLFLIIYILIIISADLQHPELLQWSGSVAISAALV